MQVVLFERKQTIQAVGEIFRDDVWIFEVRMRCLIRSVDATDPFWEGVKVQGPIRSLVQKPDSLRA